MSVYHDYMAWSIGLENTTKIDGGQSVSKRLCNYFYRDNSVTTVDVTRKNISESWVQFCVVKYDFILEHKSYSANHTRVLSISIEKLYSILVT